MLEKHQVFSKKLFNTKAPGNCLTCRRNIVGKPEKCKSHYFKRKQEPLSPVLKWFTAKFKFNVRHEIENVCFTGYSFCVKQKKLYEKRRLPSEVTRNEEIHIQRIRIIFDTRCYIAHDKCSWKVAYSLKNFWTTARCCKKSKQKKGCSKESSISWKTIYKQI